MKRIVTVNLPDIGEGVVEGEVVEWLKNVGDPLAQDEPVVVVMTDKATVELPATHPGKLFKQYFKEGETATLNRPLYDIETEGEATSTEVKDSQEVKPPSTIKVEEKPAPRPRLPEGGKALATPPVRQLAKEMGIDLSQVPASGKDGRVTVEDLKKIQGAQGALITHFPDDEELAVIGVQGLMAKKMAESKRVIPHFSYYEKVEATRLIQLRENVKKQGLKEGVQVTFMPFFIRALTLTIKEFPKINSSYDPQAKKLYVHTHHHIGCAMSSDKGLIVPVLKNVQLMSLREVIMTFEKLKNDALAGKLDPKDMKDSTITISNFGVFGSGGLWATPIINYPEAAILAVNKIQKQPFVKSGTITAADILNLSWSFDHRIIDGDLASKVSRYFANLIQNPAQLI